MKKSHAKSILVMAIFTMGIFVFKTATANGRVTETEEVAVIVPAANCAYTGNSGDECYASDGKHNYIVSNCTPGSTSCGYNP